MPTVAIALQLIAQYGVPLARSIYETWKDKHNPTTDEWDALAALVAKTKEQYVKEAQLRAAEHPDGNKVV
jgi:hypothetical protein